MHGKLPPPPSFKQAATNAPLAPRCFVGAGHVVSEQQQVGFSLGTGLNNGRRISAQRVIGIGPEDPVTSCQLKSLITCGREVVDMSPILGRIAVSVDAKLDLDAQFLGNLMGEIDCLIWLLGTYGLNNTEFMERPSK